MKSRNLSVHIEELVLHGFAPVDRHAIAEAVERELSHLLARGSSEPFAYESLQHDLVQASVDGGSFHVAANSTPSSIGSRIAWAVHGGLTSK